MDPPDFVVQLFKISSVIEDVVGLFQALTPARLCGHDLSDLLSAYAIAPGDAVDLLLLVGVNNQDAVDHIRKGCLNQQWNNDDAVRGVQSRDSLAHLRADQRMQDRFQAPAFRGITKDTLSQPPTVDPTLVVKDRVAEGAHNFAVTRLSGLCELARDRVGVNDRYAAICKQRRRG